MTTDEIAALGAPPRPGRGPAWIEPPAPGTLLTRRLPAGPRSFDPKARTFTAVIASEARVRRPPPAPDGELSEWDEILTLTEGAVDLSRVVGGPLLVNHDLNRAESHIGTITAARIENGKLVAELKLSQRASIDSVAEDIANDILRQMSCGYAVETWRKQAGDPPTFTATKWLPLEASILPLAAAGDCMVRGATLESAKMPDALVKDVEADEIPGASEVQPWTADELADLVISAEKLNVRGAGVVVDGLRQRGLSPDVARRELINLRAAEADRVQTRTARAVEVGASWDSPHDRAARMGEAVYSRLNRGHQPSEGARPYVGFTFPDLARECLRHAGQRITGISPMALITRAYQTTSDFPLIAGDAVGRELRRIYGAAPRGVLQCARFVTNADFRSKTFLTFEGSNIDLEKVGEGGEFRHGTLAEGGEAVKLATFGKIVAWTRQMAVNDDLGALERIAQLLASAAVAKEDDLAAALLVGNPTLSDGTALFHADHANLAGSGGAPPETTLDAARVAMRTQKGPNGKVIGIDPAFLIVPPSLETAARKQTAPVQATEVANVSAFVELQVIVDPRLSGTAWYLAANPAVHDGLVAAHLEGEPSPQLETRVGFSVDGTELRVRLDFGVGFVDHRSWYRNPG